MMCLLLFVGADSGTELGEIGPPTRRVPRLGELTMIVFHLDCYYRNFRIPVPPECAWISEGGTGPREFLQFFFKFPYARYN